MVAATDCNRQGLRFAPMAQVSTPLIQFVSSHFTGCSHLAMIVCLSQAPQCGWETWFSLEYGTSLAKLRSHVKPQRPRNATRLLAQMRKEVKAYQPGTGKYAQKRLAIQKGREQLIQDLKQIIPESEWKIESVDRKTASRTDGKRSTAGKQKKNAKKGPKKISKAPASKKATTPGQRTLN